MFDDVVVGVAADVSLRREPAGARLCHELFFALLLENLCAPCTEVVEEKEVGEASYCFVCCRITLAASNTTVEDEEGLDIERDLPIVAPVACVVGKDWWWR